jgi:hypothetical protein
VHDAWWRWPLYDLRLFSEFEIIRFNLFFQEILVVREIIQHNNHSQQLVLQDGNRKLLHKAHLNLTDLHSLECSRNITLKDLQKCPHNNDLIIMLISLPVSRLILPLAVLLVTDRKGGQENLLVSLNKMVHFFY